jgi:YD repeat-containing protein
VTTQIRPDSSEILFAYDSAGNLTSLTPPGKPAHGFQYNAVGLVTQYDPPTIAAGAKPTKYFYNLDRQLDSIVRPDSITVALGYDAAGRPNAVSFDRGSLTLGYSNTTGNLNRIPHTRGRQPAVHVRRLVADTSQVVGDGGGDRGGCV